MERVKGAVSSPRLHDARNTLFLNDTDETSSWQVGSLWSTIWSTHKRIRACSSSATLPTDYFNTMAIDQQAQVASNQLDIQPNDGK